MGKRGFRPGQITRKLRETEVLTGWWRRKYHEFRPHSALGYRPPAPEARILETLVR